MWKFILLLHLPLFLCQSSNDPPTPNHYFTTFLDDIPTTASPFVQEEDDFMEAMQLILDADQFNVNLEVPAYNLKHDDNRGINYMNVYATRILGNIQNPKENIYNSDLGYYRQLGFFHIQRISDSDSYITRGVFEERIQIYKEAREAQLPLQNFESLKDDCTKLLVKNIKLWYEIPINTIVNITFYPLREVYEIVESFLPSFKKCSHDNMETAKSLEDFAKYKEQYISVFFRNALFLYYDKILFAFEFSKFGEFNGQPAAPQGAQLGTIELMLYETDKAGHEIEKALVMLKQKSSSSAKSRELYEHLLYTLNRTDEEWNLEKLYTLTPGSIMYDTEIINFRQKGLVYLSNLLIPPAKSYLTKFEKIYKRNLTAFLVDGQTDPFQATYVEVPIHNTWVLFRSYFEPVPNSITDKLTSGFFIPEQGDKNFYVLSNFQNLFLGWKGLKRFNAKIKCHLQITYWDNLREKTLKRSQQPLDRIFGGISHTLFKPCVNSDTDLVGTCTAANHEICQPMRYSKRLQDYIDENEEIAYTFYSPDPYFRPITLPNGTIICEEVESYSVPLKICRCGFRTDCGSDLGKNLTCVLEPEDNFRKRCRGSIGYPCKSHALAPGRHHESCVTGFCKMRLDSCEYDDKKYPIVWSGVHRDDEI